MDAGRAGKERADWFADHHGYNGMVAVYVIRRRSKQGQSKNLGRALKDPAKVIPATPCFTEHGMGDVCDTAELPAACPLERGADPSLHWQESLSPLLYKYKSE